MSEQDARNRSQEYYESVDREWPERDEESLLPWLDEAEIVSREYNDDNPWVDEG